MEAVFVTHRIAAGGWQKSPICICRTANPALPGKTDKTYWLDDYDKRKNKMKLLAGKLDEDRNCLMAFRPLRIRLYSDGT